MEVIHFADAHIGVKTHGQIDPETGLNDRVLDFLDAFDYIIDYAESNNVDLVLFAGDMFHSNNPSPSLVSEVVIRVRELAKQCPIVMVPGNHDQALNRVSALDLFDVSGMENVHSSEYPKNYFIDTKSGVVFIGALPYPKYTMFGLDRSDAYETMLAVVDCIMNWTSIPSDDIPAILLSHLTVAGASYGSYTHTALGSESHILLDHLTTGWDYVALGHLHMHQDLTRGLNNSPPIVYSGSIERVDFGEEKETKGFIHISIADELSYEFIEIPTRPLYTLKIDARGVDDVDKHIRRAITIAKIHPDSIIRILINADDASCVVTSTIYKLLEKFYRIAALNVIVDKAETQRIDLEDGESISDLAPEELLEEYFIKLDLDDDEIDRILDIFDDIKEEIDVS